MVIRILISIYNELDIINPYKAGNEELFDNNLMKYGATKEEIDNLKRLIDGFYTIDKKNNNSLIKESNVYFIEIQKALIDFFNYKRFNYGISEEEGKIFFDLLYTPECSNALRQSYNYFTADDIYEILKYYKAKNDNKESLIY